MRHAAIEAKADATIEESEAVHTIGDEHVQQQQHTDEDSRVNANNEEDDEDVRTIPEDVPGPAEDTEETDVILANAVESTDALPVHPRALWADLGPSPTSGHGACSLFPSSPFNTYGRQK